MAVYEPTERSRVRRHADRAHYERDLVLSILDEGLICHLAFVSDGSPVVIPTMYARLGDVVYLHGNPASRMLTTLSQGVDVSMAVTLLDGLVMARSVFNHSMNYRSVVVHGRATEVADREEKMLAFKALVDHVCPGRWEEARHPTAKELATTKVVRLPLLEASAKVRTGPPKDSASDLRLPVWAGELPLRVVPQPPLPDPGLAPGLSVPDYISGYSREGGETR
jgi:uncharacterized protein